MEVYGGVGLVRRAFCIYRFDTQSSYYLLITASTSSRTMDAIVIEGRNAKTG
jgi:hypothetical protein